MIRLLVGLLLIFGTGCHGTYVRVTVESGMPMNPVLLNVTIAEAAQSGRAEFDKGGTPFSLPQSFVLRLDDQRNGAATIQIFAIGTTGELARATATTEVISGSTTDLIVQLTPLAGDMGPATDMAVLPDLGSPPVWVSQDSDTINDLFAVWGSGAAIYAVGAQGTVITTQDGGVTPWGPQALGTDALFSVWGGGAKDVYIVGGSSTFHGNGTMWNKFFNDQVSGDWNVIGGPPDQLYLSGWSQKMGGFVFVSGDGWSSHAAMVQITQFPVRALWATKNNAFAIANDAIVRSTDGGVQWRPQKDAIIKPLHGISGRGGDVWAVGDTGLILHSSNNGDFQLEESGVNSDLAAVWCGSMECVAVGQAGTVLNNASGKWQTEVAHTSQNLYGVFGTDSGVYAVGAAGTVVHRAQR